MPLVHIATPDGQRAAHDEEDVRKMDTDGAFPPGTLFWKPGMTEWRPIEEFAGQCALARSSPVAESAPPKQGTSGWAIASLVLGALAFILSVFTAIPAIICGHCALGKIKNSGGTIGGRGLAITGLVLGYGFVLLFLSLFLLIPTLGRRERDGRTIDGSNLRQIGQASLIYANDNSADLPPATLPSGARIVGGGPASLDGTVVP